MATGVSNSLAEAINDALYNGVDFSWATAYMALHTTPPSTTTFGTECTGGSYARAAISAAAASGASVLSDAALLFANMPACTITGVAFCDAASGAPTQWHYIDGLSRVVSAGENLVVNPGDLSNLISGAPAA